MEWKDIEKVNSEISTVTIEGKKKDEYGNWIKVTNDYVEVKERVIAYRKICPNGVITTELEFTDNYVLCTANATGNNEKLIATGHARELLNKAYAVENAETSAIGRCLGFMGLGISTSIASKEDMDNAESPSGIFDEKPINKAELIDEFNSIFSVEQRARILNGWNVTDPAALDADILQKYIEKKKNEK